MLSGRTIRTSIVILAAAVAASTQAQAHSTSCTPAHLVSALKQVEAECGAAKIVSAHRPGARIAGTGRVSQHSFCNGTNGAIDAVFSNRACALSALRKTNYTILTYGKSAHIHIGTDGWGNGANTNVARAIPERACGWRRGNVRALAMRRDSARAFARASAVVGRAERLERRQRVGRKLVERKRRGVRLSAALPRSLGFQAAYRRARRAAAGTWPERQRVGLELVVRALGQVKQALRRKPPGSRRAACVRSNHRCIQQDQRQDDRARGDDLSGICAVVIAKTCVFRETHVWRINTTGCIRSQ